MRDLSSPIVSNISSFVLCSVQVTFSILLQVHISKASSLFISSFLIVHVSAPYSTTLHISRAVLSIRLMRLKSQGPQSLGAHQNLESSFIDHHFQPQGPQSLGARQNFSMPLILHVYVYSEHFFAPLK